ncbi:MAG: acyltransferase family protein [Clostridia bacterium]|nr:acyltransferase family protein [Clostridia bacterium]
MEKIVENQRKSNFELLRIFAMVLIILHHYALHGGLIYINRFVVNKYIGTVCLIGGKLAVNLFVLISGYFLIESKLKVKKVLKLIVQVYCYSVPIFIIYVLFNGMPSSDIIKLTVFPFTSKSYWFILPYICVYVLSPFINVFVKGISKKQLLILIGILIFMMSGIGFVFSDTGLMSNLSWFVLLYMLGAYIRLYDFERVSSKSIKIFSVIGYVAFMIIACGITFMSQYNSSIFRILNKISSMNSIIVLIESVLIFGAFKNLEIKNNKVINVLGKSSIGVYLLHDSIFRVDFWKKICLVERFYFASPLILVAHIAVCVGGIYLIGLLIDSVRRRFFEELLFKF